MVLSSGLSSVATSIINRFLSPFLDELSANQLKLFGFSGKASLENVSVKPNAFDLLKLPIRVVHSQIGRIDISVPWMNLYTEPIVIKVSDVYLLALPNWEVRYNAEEEELFAWKAKKSALEQFESMKQKFKEEQEGKKTDDGFFVKLISAAIKNIQISIGNVHIVYEDSTTCKTPFQVGVSLSKLIFETEIDSVDEANDRIINKMVKLEGFSLYMNTKSIKRLNGFQSSELNKILRDRISKRDNYVENLEYILCPIKFHSKALIHRTPEDDGYKIPVVDLDMNLDTFCLQMSNSQIEMLMLLLKTFTEIKSSAPYLKWRPNVPVKNHAKTWWKFIFTATMETGFRQRKREYCWAAIKETCKLRKAYCDLYKRKILGEKIDNIDLEYFEKKLSLNVIITARDQAEEETKDILHQQRLDKEAQAKKGWFSGWFSKSSENKDTSSTLKIIKDEFDGGEKQKLYKAIGYEENGNNLIFYPAEFIAYKLKFSINMFKIVVKEDVTPLLNIEFDKSIFSVHYRPTSTNLFVQSELSRLTVVGLNGVMLLKGSEREKLLSFMLELNPLDKQSDLKIFLTLKDAHLLYDNKTFTRLYQICKPAESLSLEEMANFTEYELADFQQITSQRIEAAIKNHQQLMLKIQIDPSFVIIPNTGSIDNADAVLLLSLGKLYIDSKLESKAVIEETSKKMKAYSSKAKDALEHQDTPKPKHFVAEYQCNIQSIQLVLSDADHWKADIECLDTERHILYPLDITLTATLFIEPEGFKQIFMVDFSAINISRVSPRMVNITLGVLSSFESIKKPKSVVVQENVCTVDLLTPKPIDRKRTWFLNVKPATVENTEQQNGTIFSENQVLILNMEEVTIHIRISDQDTQPLVRLSMSLNLTMNDYKDLHFDCKFVANYFNTIQGAWEPIIEPVNDKHFALTGDVNLEKVCTKVRMETIDNMEILLTKTSINLLNNLSNAFLSELQKTLDVTSFGEKYKENRVIIRNYLGIPMVIDMAGSTLITAWNESSTDKNYISEEIKSGEEMSFTAENVSSVVLQVILKFASGVIERKIVCTKSATRCYFTSFNSKQGCENYKWLVNVIDHGTSKEVNFQSNTQIVNYFDQSFIIYSKSGKHFSTMGTVSPNGCMNLTLPTTYGKDLLYISPSTDFEVSDLPLDWRSLDVVDGACSSKSAKVPLLVLRCPLKSNPEKRFGIKVRAEKTNVLYEDTERMDNDEAYLYNIRLLPFVIAKNYLPYSAQVSYEASENEWFDLASGAEKILPFAVFGKSCVRYKVLNYLGQDWTCKFNLPESGEDKEDHYYEFKGTKGDDTLNLAVKFQIENNSIVLALFAPYWLVNLTQKNITYKVDSKHLFHHPESLHTQPFLLSFDPCKVSRTNKLCLSVNQSQFTDFFPLNVVPYTGTFLPQSSNKKYNLYVGVQAELALIGMSKIITVSSFYNVFNISKKNIEYSENGRDWATISSQSSKAFFPTKTSDQTMCFRFAGTKIASMHISLRQSSQTLLHIDDEFLFVEVAVNEVEAKVKISDYFYGAAPVLVINDLATSIFYGQKGVSDWASNQHVSVLPPRHMSFFCWIDPIETRELIYRLEDDKKDREVINLDFDKYQPIDGGWWITFFDGKQRVLIFTNKANLPQLLLNTEELNKPSFSLELIFKGLGIDLVDDQKKKDLLYLSIRSSSLWEGSENGNTFKILSVKETIILEEMYQLYLKLPVGSSDIVCRKGYEANFSDMKLLRPRSVRLKRFAKQGLWFRYSASEHITQYQLKINTVQVDNQLPEHFYNVAFSPVNTSRESFEKNELQQKSFIEFSAIVQSLASVKRYKCVQLLIQEFMVQVDWGWVSQVQSLFDFVPDRDQTVGALIKQDLETIAEDNTLVEMRKFVMGKTYYEYLLLGPMKAHVSVSVGDLPDGQFPFGIDFIVRFTGLTLGEINGALIRMDYFERKLTSMSTTELVNQISHHYKMQIYMQLYKLILGLDIIGNPMKLVLGIRKGIGDFFYEPASAIVLGPEAFVDGIGNGIRSLASGVLGGTAGALGRIGNRIGTGVAALTIDDEFQKERRERMNRKTGFTESGKNLFRGIYSGITGVVTKPIEGASKDGVEGFVKGFGKGVVGVIAQPATGVIDFASGSLNAFDNVIDTKQVIKAVRPPRYFSTDKKLTPYVKYAADGTYILKTLSEGKYAGEQYVYHLQAAQNSLVLLTNRKLFHLKKSMMSSSWEVDWMESWESVDKVVQESGKRLKILLKQKKKSMLIFGGVKEYSINLSNDDHTKDLLAHITRHINSTEERAN